MQVAELLVGVPAPIMYWEQGHEWLFGDPVRFQVCDTARTRSQFASQQHLTNRHGQEEPQVLAAVASVAQRVFCCVAVEGGGGGSALQVAHNYLRQDQLFHRVLHLPVAVAAVSDAVQSILAQQFGRSSLLIPNGVDCDRFFPGPPTDVAPTAILSSPTKAQVIRLLVN